MRPTPSFRPGQPGWFPSLCLAHYLKRALILFRSLPGDARGAERSDAPTVVPRFPKTPR